MSAPLLKLVEPAHVGPGGGAGEVGEHVHLAVDPLPQGLGGHRVGEQRPERAGDLSLRRRLLPKERQVRLRLRGSEPSDRPPEFGIERLIHEP
jgi:hypothetical protein